MDNFIDWWPLALFGYLIFFGLLIIMSALVGKETYARADSKKQKLMAWVAMLVLIPGFMLYLAVDWFETIHKLSLWWLVMLGLHLVPMLLCIGIIARHDHKHMPKNH